MDWLYYDDVREQYNFALARSNKSDEIFSKLTDQLSFAGSWIENHLSGFIQKLR